MKPVMMIRCAAVTLASIFATTALAGGSPERIPQRVVSYGDLNLQSKAGVTALYRRIRSAADLVCRERRGVTQLILDADIQACRMDSTDRAVAQVNLPTLTSLHFARTGRKLPDLRVAKQD